MYNKTQRVMTIMVILATLLSLFSTKVTAAPAQQSSGPVTITILHTNDFHGQLEPSGSNPGMARVAYVVNQIRSAKGAENVLLVDDGDQMQGSLLSNLQKGAPVIAVFKAMGYDAATFGNHEFDWGQDVLKERVAEAKATFPYVSANIVVNDTGNCATAGWTTPDFALPFMVKTVNGVRVGLIGVTSIETPTITIASATAGLCFKDPAESILHYYDSLKAQADVIVVLSHIGYEDGGYGYGIPVYGDKTLATKLNTAGKPVNLIIGGHSHTNLAAATMVGDTAVVQAYYNGRNLGQADITFDPATKAVTINWIRNAISTSGTKDTAIDTLINTYVNDPAYQALINQPIGYAQTDLLRNYDGDSMMGNFVDDAIYNYLNNDATPANDVDMFFNNAGGIRIDWCDKEDPANPGTYIWSSSTSDCAPGVWTHDPMLLTYGQMFQILPFGNQTIVGDMTGAQIVELLNQSATLFKGAIQPAGMRYSFFRYTDANPGPQPFAWGAFDYCVINKATKVCEPIDLKKTYRVGTNEFLAPAGQDGYVPFKYMTNISYWGDMLNAVNDWVTANYTFANPYKGPNGNGQLDGRVNRVGDNTFDTDPIIPITILHHNDSHGRLSPAYAQLASLIKQERAHNPGRTLLLNAGDQIQGDSMMYYFKNAPLGYAADGTPLTAPLTTHPMMAVMNALGYDAMTLGNHEFNFGGATFTGIFKQAQFPVMQANVSDTGEYGLGEVPVVPYITKEIDGIKLAILGIGNHRIPNYELPSNIPGLTFTNPLTKAQELANDLRPTNDVVVALTHIGFTEDPKSVEVDANVDTNMAMTVSGLDAIIGGHSHTYPTTGFGAYKYLPTIIGGPNNTPVLVTQMYRYNAYLGEVILGVRAKAGGGYELVSRAGQYIAVSSTTPEDPEIKAIVEPYATQLKAYNDTVIGQTTVPIDTRQAFTQETNGANLQADASVYELAKNGITVDFHLSGAMTNQAVALTGPYPLSLKVSDMFTLMPYENSLLVMKMNGPQLKAVLERAYRNYYYYKYVPGYGGYSYYTTCMLDINSVGKITYNDLYPAAYDPAKQYVVSLEVNGKEIDFNDADTYYRVSTVNYLAAGSCNFNNGGVSLWPLNQIVNDTQYYVRDAVIDYIKAMGTVSPAIEGRLNFITDTTAPVITINSPTASTYLHTDLPTLDFTATDDIAGVKTVWADLDGTPVTNGEVIDLLTLSLGEHTLTVYAMDKAYNQSSASVTFNVTATVESLMKALDRFYQDGSIKNKGVYTSLKYLLDAAAKSTRPEYTSSLLNTFVQLVRIHSGRLIKPEAANLLITDAQFVITHLPDTTAPYIIILSPRPTTYKNWQLLRINFDAFDRITGVMEVTATLDGVAVKDNQMIDLRTLALGEHTFVVQATDYAGNTATQTVKFTVVKAK